MVDSKTNNYPAQPACDPDGTQLRRIDLDKHLRKKTSSKILESINLYI